MKAELFTKLGNNDYYDELLLYNKETLNSNSAIRCQLSLIQMARSQNLNEQTINTKASLFTVIVYIKRKIFQTRFVIEH